MNAEIAIDVCRKAIQTVLLCSAPMLIIGLIIGLIISIFQAATQINEQTLTFVPKIIAVFVAMLIFGPWMIKLLVTFTTGLFEVMATL